MNRPEVLEIEERALVLEDYRFRHAKEEDCARLITGATLVKDAKNGRIRIVYLPLDDDCSEIVDALHTVRYNAPDERTSGMLTQSRIFGFRPRITIRDDFCTTAVLASENPYAHYIVTSYAQKVAHYYAQFNSDLYAKHRQAVSKVLPEWMIDESVFTSGIINKNNPLPYHFDAGNFKEVWSNMLVFKGQVAGGYLAVPGYDLCFEVRHNSLLMFDGQNILHGVTPIRLLSPGSFRYSIVYYALQSMWKCLPPDEEVARIQEIRTKREEKRLGRTEEGEHDTF